MPLVVPAIQKEMEAAIASALATAYAAEAGADPSSYQKMAGAIAQGVTTVLIKALQTQAQVLPGIPSTPSITVGPGKIF